MSRLLIVAALAAASACAPGRPSAVARWSKLEISFQGPPSQGRGDPNPFAIRFDVVFRGPDGKSWKVPGFYDGDGKGGLDGRVWKVRFSADRNGAWTYRTESSHAALDGNTGSFEVHDPPETAGELYRNGRLEYTGQRYLKFREGGYWLKFGADEPENILGAAFGLNDWEAKKREIDYLAENRINSVYIMTHTLDGDGKDVWPWLGATAEEAKKNRGRFDVEKLERWRGLFEHIQSKGIVIQLVLEDDSAWKGYDHARYYREIVARFGYLPALCFNFGEEHNENYSLAESLEYTKLLGEIDPYGHPRAIHNVNHPADDYVDSEQVQLTSIQTQPRHPRSLNGIAVEWMEAWLARKRRPLVVSFDEGRPAEDRRSWWGVYLGGGMWESLVRVPGGFADGASVWRELATTRTFLESVPFHEMHPANHVVRQGEAFCLAKPGQVYALYLPRGGGISVELTPGNQYRVEWFDPRGGSARPWISAGEVAGGRVSLAAPDEQDWAARLTRVNGNAEAPPTAMSAKFLSLREKAAPIHLAVLPAEDAVRCRYELVTPPRHGTLAGDGPDRVYTPRAGFTGQDSFQWRAIAGGRRSNVATVTITSNATGVNAPPKAQDQSVTVEAGRPRTMILRYEDRDGPGPYQIRITKPPKHGTVEGLDNDLVYTPSPGFRGEDTLEWVVSDGKDRSNRSTVRITVR